MSIRRYLRRRTYWSAGWSGWSALAMMFALVACTRENPVDPQVPVFPGAARLTWTRVELNTDRSPVKELGGYIVRYKNAATREWQVVVLKDPQQTSYVVTNLYPGNWDFSVTAYTRKGDEGMTSNVVSKRIN
jgi:hypothetical protein